MISDRFYKINIVFLISAIFIAIFLLGAIAYSFKFLSSNLIHAFSADEQSKEDISFDIEKAMDLNL